MRKVILILPVNIIKQTAAYPPLGLAYISAYLKSHDINCEVIDLSFDTDLFQIHNIKDRNVVYGITCTTAFYNTAKEITMILKQNDPEATICLGGAHPTVMPEYILSDDKNTDVVVVGEGEHTMYDIVKMYSNSPKTIKGIYYRDETGKITKTEGREPIQNLDELPFPDQAVFPIEKYFTKKGYRELSMITSRGCPNNCIFCQPTIHKMFGRKMRFRSAKNVVDEMEWAINKFNLDLIVFSDDTFTLSKKHTTEICQEIIKRNLKILWRVQTRVTTDEETMKLMKKAGCFLMAFGVESGSNTILKNIRKGITTEQIIKAFDTGKKVGILTYAFLMVGNEGETDETIAQTVNLIKRIKPFSGHIGITTPYPGTYLYERTKVKNTDWEKYIHIRNGTVATNISTLEADTLIKGKQAFETTLVSEAQKIRDIINLLKDGTILKTIVGKGIKDKQFIIRATKLLLSSIQKQGFRIINPKYSDVTEVDNE